MMKYWETFNGLHRILEPAAMKLSKLYKGCSWKQKTHKTRKRNLLLRIFI